MSDLLIVIGGFGLAAPVICALAADLWDTFRDRDRT